MMSVMCGIRIGTGIEDVIASRFVTPFATSDRPSLSYCARSGLGLCGFSVRRSSPLVVINRPFRALGLGICGDGHCPSLGY